MNTPNKITVVRLFLTAIFIAAFTTQSFWGNIIAIITFSIAAITDYFDGYYARKLGMVTSLGKLLDPLADKILIAAGFIYLSSTGYIDPKTSELTLYCPVWITCLIIGREFMITGLRQIAVEKGVVIAADRLGKWKTGFQLTFVITCLHHISLLQFESYTWVEDILFYLSKPEHFLMPLSFWGAIALTIISGWNYLWKNLGLLKDN